jgi:hypothetical protein
VNRSEFARKLLEHPAQLLGAGGACRNIEQPASVRLAGKFDQATAIALIQSMTLK